MAKQNSDMGLSQKRSLSKFCKHYIVILAHFDTILPQNLAKLLNERSKICIETTFGTHPSCF